MDKLRFRILFDKYLTGTLDELEQQEFDAYMSSMDEIVFSEMVDEFVQLERNKAFKKEDVFQGVLDRINDDRSVTDTKVESFKKRFILLGKVAAMLLVSGFLGFLIYQNFDAKQHSDVLLPSQEIVFSKEIELPQEDALITLADGKQMSLDKIKEDTVHYKGLEIMRLGDGTIVMNKEQDSDFFRGDETHRFSAPKGVSLRLVLPDASVVHLNSNSSVQIYASFGKKRRQVALSGEAFFEVAHNKDLPFVIHAKNTDVTVLGTTFNMSAYDEDDAVKTTLLSGSVQVETPQKQLYIKPGQQAVVRETNTIQLLEDVDMRKVLAWRDGYFRFKDESIRSIMADLAKWYPIESVEFQAGSSDRFTGSMKRSKKLRDVLNSIEQVSDLHFDIQEGRVIVMK